MPHANPDQVASVSSLIEEFKNHYSCQGCREMKEKEESQKDTKQTLPLESSTPTHSCAYCGVSDSTKNVKMMLCGRCELIKYCSANCQKLDWAGHKKVCKKKSDSTKDFCEKI